jgi:O-acetyl-ADP-ribose deacetylase (regulator of RNase III)
MRLADEAGLKSIAFSSISTGIYGFPAPRAARIAVATVLDGLKTAASVERIVFCCFSEDGARHHLDAIEAQGGDA